jgi:hypothetical protein
MQLKATLTLTVNWIQKKAQNKTKNIKRNWRSSEFSDRKMKDKE